MHRITCPHCGVRDEAEFRFRGDASVARPVDGDPAAFDTYVYQRTNAKGWAVEWWHHTYGCRRYLKVMRHTVTHTISATGHPGAELERPREAIAS